MKINIQSSNTRSPPRFRTRAVALLLVISFMVGLAPAAFATGTDDAQWLELLDYGYVQHPDHFVSGNRTEIIDNDETVHFNLPYGMTINFIDMIIYASNSVSDNITGGLDAWGYNYLTTEKISNNLWRVYGSIPEHTYEKVEICFTSSSTSGYVNFYSCRVKFVAGSVVTVGDIAILGPGVYTNWDGFYEGVQFGDALWLQQFDIQLTFRDWRRYDTITLAIRTRVDQLTSMYTALSDQTTVPSTYTMIENAPENGYYMFLVTIDLSDVDRTSRDAMYLFITGKGMDETTNQMEFMYCTGTVNIRYPDPVLYWFQELAKIQRESLAKIDSIGSAVEAMAGVVGNTYVEVMNIMDILGNGFYPIFEEVRSNVQGIYDKLVEFKTSVERWLSDIFLEIRELGARIERALTPNLSEHQESMDDAASQATEIQDAMEDLEQMERPEVDDIPANITTIITGNEVIIATQGLGLLMMNPVLRELLTMAFTLALAAYVLFGKR